MSGPQPPKFIIRRHDDWPESNDEADDMENAKGIAEEMARDQPGRLVTIYQRLLIVRTHEEVEDVSDAL